MATIFTTKWNYAEIGPEMQENTQPSQTQPDEVMSIREMLERHVRGLPVPNAKDEAHFYPPEMGYIPSLAELDLSEMEDYRDHYKNQVKELELKIKEEKSSLKSQKSGEADRPLPSDGQQTNDGDVEPAEG